MSKKAHPIPSRLGWRNANVAVAVGVVVKRATATAIVTGRQVCLWPAKAVR